MANLSPEEVAAKWAQRTSAAVPDYARGIAGVTTAPGQLAARAAQKYAAKVQENVEKFARNSAAVSLGEWQQAATEKGGQRLATGAQAAQGKMAGFMAELLPHIDRGRSALASMPNMTLQDSKNRAVAWIDHMANFRRAGR